jgi:hypothetical protein
VVIIFTGQRLTNVSTDPPDVVQVQTSVRIAGRSYTDYRDGTVFNSLMCVCSSQYAILVHALAYQFGEALFNDGALPLAYHFHFGGINVYADNLVSVLSKTGC